MNGLRNDTDLKMSHPMSRLIGYVLQIDMISNPMDGTSILRRIIHSTEKTITKASMQGIHIRLWWPNSTNNNGTAFHACSSTILSYGWTGPLKSRRLTLLKGFQKRISRAGNTSFTQPWRTNAGRVILSDTPRPIGLDKTSRIKMWIVNYVRTKTMAFRFIRKGWCFARALWCSIDVDIEIWSIHSSICGTVRPYITRHKINSVFRTVSGHYRTSRIIGFEEHRIRGRYGLSNTAIINDLKRNRE